MRIAAIERGLDIGRTAGEDHAIQPVQQRADIGMGAVGRDQHWHAADHLAHGPDIGVRHGMVEHRETAEKLLAAGDTDERLHSCDNAAAKPVRKAILARGRRLFGAAIHQG
jgi:formyltetrahydrofolate hydrolase